MGKTTVAIVCDSVNLQFAGSLVSTWRYAQCLADRGHKVILISTGEADSIEHLEGVKIIRFQAPAMPGTGGGFRMRLFVSSSKIKKILVEEEVKIVHFMIPTPLCLKVSKVAKKLGLPVIAHSHTQPENILMVLKLNNHFMNWLFYRYLIWSYSRADFIVCPTLFAENKLKMYGNKKKIRLISNGVDLERFKMQPVPASFYSRFKLDPKKKHILFVGRLWPEKNLKTLIMAMPFILQKIPTAHLDIVGKKENQYAKLRALVKELRLDKQVTFLGLVSNKDLVHAYNAATVFCLPSLVELEGMVVLEAMAQGKPIVIANAPESAAKFYVQENGYTFEFNNPANLAEKVIDILSDEDLQRKMMAKSLSLAQELDMQRCVDKLEDLYQQCSKVGEPEELCYYQKNTFHQNRETIVFLHGLTGHSGVWKKYLHYFDKKYNLLAIDLVGHGQSYRPYSFNKYSPTALSQEVLKILKKENINSAHFVVHSYAFLILLELIKADKRLVKSSVAISPYYPPKETVLWKLERLLSIPAAAVAYFIPTSKQYSLGDYQQEGITADLNVRRIVSDTLRTGIKSYIALNYYSLKYESSEIFKRIKVPFLLITGKRDLVIPVTQVQKLSGKIVNSTLVVLEKNAHVLVYPFHAKVIPHIDLFLEQAEQNLQPLRVS